MLNKLKYLSRLRAISRAAYPKFQLFFLICALLFLIFAAFHNTEEIAQLFSSDRVDLRLEEIERVLTIFTFMLAISANLVMRAVNIDGIDSKDKVSLTFMYMQFMTVKYNTAVFLLALIALGSTFLNYIFNIGFASIEVIPVNACLSVVAFLMVLTHMVTNYRIKRRKFGYNSYEMGELVYFVSHVQKNDAPPSSSGLSGRVSPSKKKIPVWGAFGAQAR